MKYYTCSLCGGELTRGRVAIRKSIAAKLSWPFPSDRLFFKPDKGESKSELVIQEGGSYEAFKCGACGSIMITKESWVPEI